MANFPYYWILFFLVLLLLVYSIFVEPNRIQIREINLEIKGLPSSFKKFKIVHLSDLHIHQLGCREKKVIRINQEANPDIILITGDLIGGKAGISAGIDFLGSLSAKYGIWMVPGNNDHLNRKKRGILYADRLPKEVKLLINQAENLSENGDNLWIIGVDDPYEGYDSLEEAMANVPRDSVKILLAHSPEIVEKAVNRRIDLVLVGHTHGGQVNFPLIGPLYSHTRLGKKYIYGLHKVNSTQVYVHRGIGMSVLPLRFLSPPEVVIFKLERK